MARKGGAPENLKPFPKGVSGNPSGARKLPDIKLLLEEVLGEQQNGMTAAEALMKKLRQMGTAGNLKAIEMLLDRAYGKPKQTVDTNITGIRPVIKVMDQEDADAIKTLLQNNGTDSEEHTIL